MRVMKRFKAIFLALLVVLSCSLCACKSPEEEVIKLPDVHVGEEFEIIITDGYAQSFLYPLYQESGLKFIDSHYVETTTDGSLTKVALTFCALMEGVYRIRIPVISNRDSSIVQNNLYEIRIL